MVSKQKELYFEEMLQTCCTSMVFFHYGHQGRDLTCLTVVYSVLDHVKDEIDIVISYIINVIETALQTLLRIYHLLYVK